MKRSGRKLTAITLAVLLFCGVLLTAVTLGDSSLSLNARAAGSTTASPEITANINTQDYNRQYLSTPNFSYPMRSYMYDSGNSTVTRVEYVEDGTAANGGYILVEKYSSDYTLLSQQTIAMELPIWGGFYSGTDYNFIIEGQTNPNEIDETEVMRVIRYSKDWKRIDSAGHTGYNTTVPFDAGCLRMSQYGDILFVRTAHEMYLADDGYNHQANVTFTVDIPSMEIVDSLHRVLNRNYGYVSHSFNQFIDTTDGVVTAVDHGDALPRSIALFRYPTPATEASFTGKRVEYIDMIPISGTVGDNYTGYELGGYEVSESSYMVAYAKNELSTSSISGNGLWNIYVTVTPRNNFTQEATKTIQITDVEQSTEWVSTPHLVKINSNKLLLMWTKGSSLHYVFLDKDGKVINNKYYEAAAGLSDCHPVVIGNTVKWYTSVAEISYSGSAGNSDYEKHVKPYSLAFYEINTDSGAFSVKRSVLPDESVELQVNSIRNDTFATKYDYRLYSFTAPADGEYSISVSATVTGYIFDNLNDLLVGDKQSFTKSTLQMKAGDTVYIYTMCYGYSSPASSTYYAAYTVKVSEPYQVSYMLTGDIPGDISIPTDSKVYLWHDKVSPVSMYSSSTKETSRNGVPGKYTFSGWSANAALTADGIEGDVVFTGNWTFTPATYTISFNPSTIPSQTKTHGVDLILTTQTPNKTGHTFCGWALTAGSTTADYLPGGRFTLDKNQLLHAVWTPNTYEVRYDANGGTGAPASQTKIYGQTLQLTTQQPTRTGFEFLGWSKYATSSYASYKGGDSYTSNSEITFYAVWKELTYQVKYDANGGTNAPSAQTKRYTADLILSSAIPNYNGYIFQGWSSSKTATSAEYQAGGTYSTNADVTLYAVWRPVSVSYSLTPAIKGAASKLYEPWGLKYFASYDGDDVDKITERGVVMLKDEFYTVGMTPEAFCANENAYDFSSARDELGFEAPSTKYPNGRYTALLDEGIYSYDISAAYYALPYAVMENGQIVYGTIRNISMEQVLNSNLSSSAVSAEEKTICTCILALKESVATYYSATGIQGASIDIHAPRGSSQIAASKVMTPAESGITPSVKGAASRLIEPWGLKFTAAYTADSRIADRGIVMLREDSYSATYASNQDAMRLNAEAYIFTEGDETLQYVASSDRYSALLTEGISSRDISAAYYAAPFVVLNDGSYVYGTVRSISMLNILNTNLSSSAVSAEEKAVCQDIIDLYEAVKAFYEAE